MLEDFIKESTKVGFNDIPFINYKKRSMSLQIYMFTAKTRKIFTKEYKCKINY